MNRALDAPAHPQIPSTGRERDGVKIVAATGAFATATDVTVQAYGIDYGSTFESSPWAGLYVVSTAEEVALSAPVTIEIPRSAQGLRAVQMIDGHWSPVEVTGDESSARIEIPHFSEVMTLGTEAFNEQRRAELPDIAAGDAPADFLRLLFTERFHDGSWAHGPIAHPFFWIMRQAVA